MAIGNELKQVKKLSKKAYLHSKKTKGERLGWESLDNVEKVPLRDIVGEGRIVSCFTSYSKKNIL